MIVRCLADARLVEQVKRYETILPIILLEWIYLFYSIHGISMWIQGISSEFRDLSKIHFHKITIK